MEKSDTYAVKDNPKKVEFAFLVGVQLPGDSMEHAAELLEELKELTATFGVTVVGDTLVKIRKPQSKYLVGSGKAEEVIEKSRELEADVIIFDDPLSPSQQRNWEALSENEIAVIDRHEVILDIFAERAHTKEAILQVALARAEYNFPRLKRMWTHLSRQKGGSVGNKGEGEQQIELDQRMITARIATLKKQLVEVGKQRMEQRKQRRKKPVPTAAIVGYTNAGKSSLLNALTNADVLAEDKLFATLDPTTRRVRIANGQEVLLTDTVGLVRKLPHSLIDSFKATLEETVIADFLIEIIDVSNPEFEEHHKTTNAVLKEVGVKNKPTLLVFNKLDRITDDYTVRRIKRNYPHAIFISIKEGTGMEELMERINEELCQGFHEVQILVPYDRHDLIAKIHRTCQVMSKEYEDDGVVMDISIPLEMCEELKKFYQTT